MESLPQPFSCPCPRSENPRLEVLSRSFDLAPQFADLGTEFQRGAVADRVRSQVPFPLPHLHPKHGDWSRVGGEEPSYFASPSSHWLLPPLALLATIALTWQAAEPAGKGWDGSLGAHEGGVEQDLICSRCQRYFGETEAQWRRSLEAS